MKSVFSFIALFSNGVGIISVVAINLSYLEAESSKVVTEYLFQSEAWVMLGCVYGM